MNALQHIGVASAPPAAVMRLLGRYSREELAMFVTVAIDLIDLVEPDTDIEPNGDELDGTGGEDDFCLHSGYLGMPGCPVSDPPEEDDHAGECSEDEISCGPGNWGGALPRRDTGPGCEISDPDHGLCEIRS